MVCFYYWVHQTYYVCGWHCWYVFTFIWSCLLTKIILPHAWWAPAIHLQRYDFIRLHDVVVRGLRLYLSLYIFSSAIQWAHWTELNQNRPHARKWARFENAPPKFGISPPPKIWGLTTVFRRLHNLTVTSTAYIFGINMTQTTQQGRWKLQWISYIVSKSQV